MIEQLIADVQQQMLPHLNNEQLQKLRDALVFCLHGMEVKPSIAEPMKKQPDMVHAFIAAKRIESMNHIWLFTTKQLQQCWIL